MRKIQEAIARSLGEQIRRAQEAVTNPLIEEIQKRQQSGIGALPMVWRPQSSGRVSGLPTESQVDAADDADES